MYNGLVMMKIPIWSFKIILGFCLYSILYVVIFIALKKRIFSNIFHEHVLNVALNNNKLAIRYTENALNRKYFESQLNNINIFKITYNNVAYKIRFGGLFASMNIYIETLNGRKIYINHSISACEKLIKFLHSNYYLIPNFSYDIQNPNSYGSKKLQQFINQI